VIAVLRQGDPLAYGLEMAEVELRRRRENLRRCQRDEAAATRELERASRRRFGLRDRPAITAAEVGLDRAQSATARMSASVSEAEATVAAERAAATARARAEAASTTSGGYSVTTSTPSPPRSKPGARRASRRSQTAIRSTSDSAICSASHPWTTPVAGCGASSPGASRRPSTSPAVGPTCRGRPIQSTGWCATSWNRTPSASRLFACS